MKSFNKKLSVYASLMLSGLVLIVAFTNCSENSFEAAESLGDPFIDYAWHLKNTGQKVFATSGGSAGVDLNLSKTWASGLSGAGVKILISDDGIEDAHQDLKGNYNYGKISKDYTLAHPYLATSSPPRNADDNHGTSVAGLAAAVGNNGFGSKGVAFRASLVAANFLSDSVNQLEAVIVDQANGDYDIFNMSWGATQNAVSTPLESLQAQFRAGALYRRNAKGSIYVKASGNDFFVDCRGSTSSTCIGNSNFDSDNVHPYTIMVGALNAAGQAASYSSPGSNLWISSFGGEFGDDDPAMITTDRMGCNLGFSQSTVTGTTVKFEKGTNGNTNCNYTSTFNGTSSAAPVLSGAIALILEANPNLTWRDVKYILAKTAVPVFFTSGNISQHGNNEALPPSAIWEYGWITNGAGFNFHNWYGFGRVDVDAATAMAKNFTSPFGAYVEGSFESNVRSGLSITPADFTASGSSDNMTVTENLKIESVQLRVTASATSDISQMGIELTSPSGKKSYVVNMNNSLRGLIGYSEIIFATNAFYQERSQGQWTIRVMDGKSGAGTVTLTKWSLRFTGSN